MNPLRGFQGTPVAPQPNNQMINMIQQFNKFCSMFQGNPQQAVQELLQSGRMTQEQFAQYKQTAEQMMNFFR